MRARPSILAWVYWAGVGMGAILMWLVVSVLVLWWARGAVAQSGAHGDHHAQHHDMYRNWKPPGNPLTSCCNDKDCRPTRAYVHEDGYWRAWDGAVWLVVPPDRILPTDLAGDGRSHLCSTPYGRVICFSPGPPRS